MRKEQLIIRTLKNSQISEPIPHNELLSDLPLAFVNGYIHWMNIKSQEIEFRPLMEQWQSDPNNWSLHYQPIRKSVSTIRHHKRKLVDLRSATFQAVMDIFGALETPDHVHVTFSEEQGLGVSLVRFDLNFVMNSERHFECRELGKIWILINL